MSASQPVERVVALLHEASYERLPQPVQIAGIPFEFSAVLAVSSSLDLVGGPSAAAGARALCGLCGVHGLHDVVGVLQGWLGAEPTVGDTRAAPTRPSAAP